jgi:hypothetical protein
VHALTAFAGREEQPSRIMPSRPQSFSGLALLLTRALRFFHGDMHLRLQGAHTRRDENVA